MHMNYRTVLGVKDFTDGEESIYIHHETVSYSMASSNWSTSEN